LATPAGAAILIFFAGLTVVFLGAKSILAEVTGGTINVLLAGVGRLTGNAATTGFLLAEEGGRTIFVVITVNGTEALALLQN